MLDVLEATDLGAFFFFRHLITPTTSLLFQGISLLGNPWTLLLLTLLVMLLFAKKGKMYRSLLLAVLFVAATGTALVLRELHLRKPPPHPWVAGEAIRSSSFPSMHALLSMTMLLSLILLIRQELSSNKGRWFLTLGGGLLILLIGFSRMAMGACYLTDVLGGWMAGLTLAMLGMEWMRIRERIES